MTRKDAETLAGWVLATLAILVVVGWWTAPGESAHAVGPLNPTPAPPLGDGTLTYTAVTASGVGPDAVTAPILIFMIAGAMLVGLLFFSPRPLPRKRRQPRRSGAVVAYYLLRQAYSSIAPGAVLETVMRNSTLLLVFFNRSTSRSMA